MIPLSSATSPLIRTCKKRSARGVPSPTQASTSCGCLKFVIPASGSGLMWISLQPLRFARSRAVSIRGWLVPGFCPITKIAWARSKSSRVTVPFPAPIVSDNADSARFVTHVGTVRKVVGAKLSHEELIEKRSLVAGSSRRVENCFIRMIQRIQFGGDKRKRGFPTNGFVMSGTTRQNHRMRNSSLRAQPVIGFVCKVCKTPVSKEVRRDTLRCGFVGNVFRTVLAKLCMGSLAIGFGPGTTGTIEAALLIQFQQSACSTHNTHFRQGAL